MAIRCHLRLGKVAMKSNVAKRSIVLQGHKTSVSLESEFWEGLREIATRKKMRLPALLMEIDAGRRNANLSSAIRIFVFQYFRYPGHAGKPQPGPRGVLAAETDLPSYL